MSEKTLYLECYSGISGDMTVAALLDLGASEQILRETLASLGVEGYGLHIGRVEKCGVAACDFDVVLTGEERPHTHKNCHVHSHEGCHEHSHENCHEHTHESFHGHTHGNTQEHTHTHVHRTFRDIRELLEQANLKPGVRKRALGIFEVVARAEGKVHGKPMDEVHFHEVGAVDSIVDIVGVAVCLEDLGIERVYISNIYEGSGHVWCQHGKLPVPVPAVAQIATEYGLPLVLTGQQGEMVTPTGAAIAAALGEGEVPRTFTIQKIGIGAGKKDFERANILRAMLIEVPEQEEIWELESNVDDCPGEALGYAMECLLEAGARDVYFTPIYMKKCRPAYKICVLCQEADIRTLEGILFRETTTIGIRRRRMERTVLKREQKECRTSLGIVQVKVCERDGEIYQYPEYEDVCRLARESGRSYREVYERVREEL
ncbi:MAG: nickel pincer cofactor biosynthesis protein LarC [Lachnospiraceae bacterium]|nr:nickel pincer cofactor biosynthesis protein LarC [Lachnospiraceae bacterium]